MTLDEKTDAVTAALMPMIHKMVKAEAAKIAARPAVVRMTQPDDEIMSACRAVAGAVDVLRQAQFAGAREAGARCSLVKAADRLQRVMKKHGRV